MRKSFSFVICLLLFSACDQTFLPKPQGYNRIDLPPHQFVKLADGYPYTLDYSESAFVEKDSFNLAEETWINLNYQGFGAKVHLTYKKIDGDQVDFKMLSEDAFKLTAKHQKKAYGIDEAILVTPEGYAGVVAELDGEVPTQFQFFVTDSTKHFLRGALYFNTATKNDSLMPVIEYIKVDMAHLMNSVKFLN